MPDQQQRVLLVEDNDDDQEVILEMLSRSRKPSFEIQCTNSLSSALSHIEHNSFDAILLDFNLPDNECVTAFLEVIAQAHDTPVVILTGLDDVPLGRGIVSDCGQVFLVKREPQASDLPRVLKDAIQKTVLQQRLQAAEAQLAHISRVTTMGEMASALVHELAQPLGAASNYAGGCLHLIEGEHPSLADLREPLRQLNEQILAAGEIIQRVKSFVSKLPHQKKKLQLNTLVREVNRLLPKYGDQSGITRRLDLDADLPDVLGDQVQIKQVLVNLVRNAMDAVADESLLDREVVIRTLLTSGTPTVCIIDRGPGIPDGQIDQIFEPYVTTKSDGMGMGLSICRTIIQNHAGRIWTEVNDNGHTCFCFTLPTAEAIKTPKTTGFTRSDAAEQSAPRGIRTLGSRDSMSPSERTNLLD